MVRNILCSVIIIFCLVSNTYGSPEPADSGSESITVDFDGAPLQEVIFTVSELTGFGFVWPKSDILINWSQQDIKQAELVSTFNDILSSYGLTSVPLKDRSNFFSIQAVSQLTSGTDSNGVYFPHYINVDTLQDSIVTLYGPRLTFLAVPENNSIFFSGAPALVESFISVIVELDQPAQNMRISSFKLQHIPVKAAIELLESLSIDSDILPDYWNRSVVVRGSSIDVDIITKALKAIDKPQVGYADKISLLTTLTPEQAATTLSGLYPDVTFTGVAEHKILLSGDSIKVNEAFVMLQKLDGSDYQVKVEAIIASLTDSEFYELGTKLTVHQDDFRFVLNDSFDALLKNHTGLLVDYFSDLLGFHIAAKDGVARGEILSSPVLMVLNGKTARLHVGQNVPFLKSARISEQQQDKEGIEIVRQDVGLTFEITPTVDPDGQFVHININQVVSAIQPDSENSSQAADIITDKKELYTTVLVADGETVFLGGLKSEENGSSTDKVPFLGDVPVLGALFTYDNEKNVTRHLVISLRVNVIAKV